MAGAAVRYRAWEGLLEELMRELRRGRAARTTLAALLVEAPPSARGLYSREAALSGAAVALALRTMGAAALVPLGFGAAAAGVAYLTQRRRIDEARAAMRVVLADGQRAWDALWRRWLDGALTRPATRPGDRSVDRDSGPSARTIRGTMSSVVIA